MTKQFLAFALMIGVVFAAAPAQADWDPGDPYKMHFPQLPDPNGWDVEFVSATNKIGDDWLCTETGPVSDIHIWLSWQADNAAGGGLPGRIDSVGVEIYKNVDPDALLPYSRPEVTPVWSQVFDPTQFSRRPYGQGDQGWYSPQLGMLPGVAWQRPDHVSYEQLNIVDIDNPFIQNEGEVYWLVMWVAWEGTQNAAGWKTADLEQYPINPGQHFMDDAVWYEWTEDNPQLRWNEIIDPITLQSLDLAFVITPEPASMALLTLGVLAMLRRR